MHAIRTNAILALLILLLVAIVSGRITVAKGAARATHPNPGVVRTVESSSSLSSTPRSVIEAQTRQLQRFEKSQALARRKRALADNNGAKLIVSDKFLKYYDECSSKKLREYDFLFWGSERFNESRKITATLGNALQVDDMIGAGINLIPCGGTSFCLMITFLNENLFATKYAKGKWTFEPPSVKNRIKFRRKNGFLLTSGSRYFASNTKLACDSKAFKAILATDKAHGLQVILKRVVDR